MPPSSSPAPRLGDILVQQGALARGVIEACLAERPADDPRPIGAWLLSRGLIDAG